MVADKEETDVFNVAMSMDFVTAMFELMTHLFH